MIARGLFPLVLSGLKRGAFAALLLLLLPTPSHAQVSPSQYTTATRYDLLGRVTGVIGGDADGAGPLGRVSERRSYDVDGRLVRVETGVLAGWQDEGVAPAAWSGFSVLSVADSVYDVGGRKVRARVSAGGVVLSQVEYRYDALDRVVCSAQRMNPAVYASAPVDACTLGPAGSFGADRITRTLYDGAGRVTAVQKAVGTALQQDYVRYGYSGNGQRARVIDANNNLTTYSYDALDRLARTTFPSKTAVGQTSAADYEAYEYDAGGNRTSVRKRDGSVLTYSYDALNRVSVKVVPERVGLSVYHTRDVYYGYDNRGLQLYARFGSISGEGVANSYDALGRTVSQWVVQGGLNKTLTYGYDANGNRTRLSYPDGQAFDYGYNGTDQIERVTNGANTYVARFFDGYGRVSVVGWAPGNRNDYGYDALSRLTVQSSDLIGTAGDVLRTFSYTPASQIAARSTDNDAYAFGGNVNVSRPYVANGLNQYTSAGPATFTR